MAYLNTFHRKWTLYKSLHGMLESALFSWNRSVWCWFSIAENFGFALSFLVFYLAKPLPLPFPDTTSSFWRVSRAGNWLWKQLQSWKRKNWRIGRRGRKGEEWRLKRGSWGEQSMSNEKVFCGAPVKEIWNILSRPASCRAPFRVPLQHVMPSPISPPPSVSMPSPIPRPCAPHDISPKHPMEDESWWDFRPQASPDDDQGGFTRRTGISCQLIYENSMVWPNHCIVWHGTYGITPTHVPKASTAFTHHCH